MIASNAVAFDISSDKNCIVMHLVLMIYYCAVDCVSTRFVTLLTLEVSMSSTFVIDVVSFSYFAYLSII
jgi:hypothetical protein